MSPSCAISSASSGRATTGGWPAGPAGASSTDVELTEQIRQIHSDLHGHPGVRRVWAELIAAGIRVARKRVWRLMRAAGLQGRHPRAWKKTTVAGHGPSMPRI